LVDSVFFIKQLPAQLPPVRRPNEPKASRDCASLRRHARGGLSPLESVLKGLVGYSFLRGLLCECGPLLRQRLLQVFGKWVPSPQALVKAFPPPPSALMLSKQSFRPVVMQLRPVKSLFGVFLCTFSSTVPPFLFLKIPLSGLSSRVVVPSIILFLLSWACRLERVF